MPFSFESCLLRSRRRCPALCHDLLGLLRCVAFVSLINITYMMLEVGTTYGTNHGFRVVDTFALAKSDLGGRSAVFFSFKPTKWLDERHDAMLQGENLGLRAYKYYIGDMAALKKERRDHLRVFCVVRLFVESCCDRVFCFCFFTLAVNW